MKHLKRGEDLAATIALHGERAKEKEVIVDTTVQEPERSGDRLP